MRHGFGIYGTGFASSALLIGLLAAIFVVLAIFFVFRRKSSPGQTGLIEILNIQYAKGKIGEERYHEIKLIIEDEVSETTAMMIAKDRFARGEISSEEFIKTRNFINSSGNKI